MFLCSFILLFINVSKCFINFTIKITWYVDLLLRKETLLKILIRMANLSDFPEVTRSCESQNLEVNGSQWRIFIVMSHYLQIAVC